MSRKIALPYAEAFFEYMLDIVIFELDRDADFSCLELLSPGTGEAPKGNNREDTKIILMGKTIKELQLFLSYLENDEDNENIVMNFFNHPLVRPSDKRVTLEKIFDKSFSVHTYKFLNYLLDQNRISCLKIIVEQLILIKNKNSGVAIVDITSARELTLSQQKKVEDSLKLIIGKSIVMVALMEDEKRYALTKAKMEDDKEYTLTKSKSKQENSDELNKLLKKLNRENHLTTREHEITYHVNPSLMTGITIKIDFYMIDLSLKNYLNNQLKDLIKKHDINLG